MMNDELSYHHSCHCSYKNINVDCRLMIIALTSYTCTINAFQLVLIQFCVSFIDIHNKKIYYGKYQNIHNVSLKGDYCNILSRQKIQELEYKISYDYALADIGGWRIQRTPT